MATSDFSVRVRLCTRVEGSKSQPTSVRASAGAPGRRIPVDRAAAHGKALREADILRHRHPFDEAEILVHEGVRLALGGLGRTMMVGLAAKKDVAAVRPVDAGERLDERRPADAVLAEQRENLAPPQVKRHARQCPGAAELLRDGTELQQLALDHPLLPKLYDAMEH